MSKTKEKKGFSKVLLIQESVLIWIITIYLCVIAGVCVAKGYEGALPWITGLVGFPWTAYAVSQSFYYKKAEKENCAGGLVHDMQMRNKQEPEYDYASEHIPYVPETPPDTTNTKKDLDLNGPI